MAPLRILVNGAGVCGPALAIFLLGSNLDCSITIVERSPELRTGGQQIDLRDEGIPLMRRLGLLDVVKERTVDEHALVFVNSEGVPQASFGVNRSGKGAQSFVSEYEIMRGDLVKVLYDRSLEMASELKRKDGNNKSLKYEFGKYATDLIQDGSTSTVTVTFSDGTKGEYDLVVGADGQGSKTRRLIFGQEAGEKAFESRDLMICLWTQPKSESDKARKEAVVYNCPGRRVANIRTAAETGTQSMLAIVGKTQLLRDASKLSIEEQKRTWDALFRGAGWETDRLLEGLKNADDYYMSEIGQVKTSEWSKGRVVLLGDAGYCPGPITGMGTTVSLLGAYTLAGNIAEHPNDIETALKKYDQDLRPFVTSAQRLAPGIPGIVYPRTAFGVSCIRWVLWTVMTLKIDQLFGLLAPKAKDNFKVTEYPALNLPEKQKSSA